jgi:hypothetical protein
MSDTTARYLLAIYVHAHQTGNSVPPHIDAEARAALTQSDPQGPTDEELDEFAIYWWGTETDERSVSDVIECGSMAAYAQAALARYGRPAIEPVPGVEGADG